MGTTTTAEVPSLSVSRASATEEETMTGITTKLGERVVHYQKRGGVTSPSSDRTGASCDRACGMEDGCRRRYQDQPSRSRLLLHDHPPLVVEAGGETSGRVADRERPE